MSTNLSSSNESLLESHVFSGESFVPEYLYCYTSEESSFMYSSFQITNICLLLPLCTFILHCGHQHWQKRGVSSSVGSISHTDCFTYHMVTMELIGVCGNAVCSCGIYRKDMKVIAGGNLTCGLNWYGEIFFYVLTCLERYLAVVHPITYLKLRTERWIRMRNVTIGLVWLFCIIALVLVVLKMFFFMDLLLLVSSLAVASFCSLSVLCVLIHPSPGERGKGREGLDQSKQRAFNSILTILGIIVVRFVFNISWEIVYRSKGVEACLVLSTFTWFNIPSSLVLPLLFLHRRGKYMCCRNNSK